MTENHCSKRVQIPRLEPQNNLPTVAADCRAPKSTSQFLKNEDASKEIMVAMISELQNSNVLLKLNGGNTSVRAANSRVGKLADPLNNGLLLACLAVSMVVCV